MKHRIFLFDGLDKKEIYSECSCDRPEYVYQNPTFNDNFYIMQCDSCKEIFYFDKEKTKLVLVKFNPHGEVQFIKETEEMKEIIKNWMDPIF